MLAVLHGIECQCLIRKKFYKIATITTHIFSLPLFHQQAKKSIVTSFKVEVGHGEVPVVVLLGRGQEVPDQNVESGRGMVLLFVRRAFFVVRLFDKFFYLQVTNPINEHIAQ